MLLRLARWGWFSLVTISLAGCASSGERQLQSWAQQYGFTHYVLQPNTLHLRALTRQTKHDSKLLTIYIEGDGAAWSSPYSPPTDPTPRHPIALSLAAVDNTAVAYLGRPCQYLTEPQLADCPARYWTKQRFAPEVIAAYMQALDQLKSAHHASQIRLVGHSGGGVIATLLSAQRRDVVSLITVASPLHVAEWIRWHDATPLSGSLDPMQLSGTLPYSLHFVGERDEIVPQPIVASFVAQHGGKLVLVPNFSHDCCWARDWALLLKGTK